MTFPLDHYTPYGYLDLPHHTRRLSPLGVLRSEGVGFFWHFPSYAGSYGGQRARYVAGFRLALDEAFEIADFDEITAPYHSKNLFEFLLRRGSASIEALFHPVGDNALRARVSLYGAGRVQLGLHARYNRIIGATGDWGESGLVGRWEGNVLVLQAFESGETFFLHCSLEPVVKELTSEPDGALLEKGTLCALGQRNQLVELHGRLGWEIDLDSGPRELVIHMARGLTGPLARAELERAIAWGDAEEARLQLEDKTFWETAPRLEGDWPEHWRRGLVYDQETVRMMVKPPIGIYTLPWDAMQIHAPRVVLAESAIDALLLSYADPAGGAQLLSDTFFDAPEPNIPCSREDGSYNMVSADGAACGTAPSWGYPWLVLEQLVALYPEREWLEELYPLLEKYLDWWLVNRRDESGWLAYNCSWESGQDDSPRFGAQPLGGGHPTGAVRPVDLHAAFCHAAGVMAHLAGRLGDGAAQERWNGLAEEFRRRIEQLWNGARYADFDTRLGDFTAVDDVMLLAPLALGVAAEGCAHSLQEAIAAIDPATLTWPMFAWTAVEAALNAGLPERAAELAAAVCERAYGFWDAHRYEPPKTMPGVACEYWPPSGRCAGEGYGWGAFTTHLVLHALLGLSFSETYLSLRPNLPRAWWTPGRRYGLQWNARGKPVSIVLEPLEGERVKVTVNETTWEGRWGEKRDVSWDALAISERK